MLKLLETHSLRRKILRQLTMVFAFMGVIGSIGAYSIGYYHVTRSYDRDLDNDLETLAGHIEKHDQQWIIDFPKAAERWLMANEGEHVIYRVVDLTKHVVLLSNDNFSSVSSQQASWPQKRFRTQSLHGTNFRIASVTWPRNASKPNLLIEIGETLGRRKRLAQHLMESMLLLSLLVSISAAVIVHNGFGRALEPLRQLEQQLAKRTTTDLTPLDLSRTPYEVRGLLRAINQMMNRVAQAIDAQGHFIANIAHQLRTPVTALRLHAQLALDGSAQASEKPHLNAISIGTKRMGHIIDQLLVLARAEAGDASAISEKVDLMLVVHHVIERHLPGALAKDIDLGFQGIPDQASTSGNRVLLEELLSNLVDNAIRYTKSGGTVSISIQNEAEQLRLCVMDNGPGIENSNDLFLRFWRGDAAAYEGAGLGLAIVKEIAHLHGAKLSCVTAPGKGVAMTVDFRPLH